jgi:hypothetical protein
MADNDLMAKRPIEKKMLSLVRRTQKEEGVSAEIMLAELFASLLEDELRKRPTPNTLGTDCAYKETMNVFWRAKHDQYDADRQKVVDILFRLGGMAQVAVEPPEGPIMKMAEYD